MITTEIKSAAFKATLEEQGARDVHARALKDNRPIAIAYWSAKGEFSFRHPLGASERIVDEDAKGVLNPASCERVAEKIRSAYGEAGLPTGNLVILISEITR